MTDAIHIRQATPADAPFIVESNIAMAAETEGMGLDPAVVGPGVDAVLADGSLGFYLVAEVDGRIAGQLMVTFEWSDWRNGLWWWIQSVYVWPEYRRQGVYSALHRHVAEAARAAASATRSGQAQGQRVCGLRLYVEQENTTAQQVYRSLDMYPTRYYMYEVEF